MAKEYLRQVYDLDSQEATDEYYSAWAETYDAEMAAQGYRAPERCAAALAQFAPADAALLDIGCGTGISGVAFAAAGFTNVSGQDVNPDMLQVAETRNVYRELRRTDLANQFPFEPGTYAALAAVGVIGIGAGPATLLAESLDMLVPGGHLVFSYNDHALADPEYAKALSLALSSGRATEVFGEHGPHFDGLKSKSTIYVLQRQ